MLAEWLAKGDLGAEDEPDVELEMNGNGRFKGVNPEYERVRTDSDGDGLSDRWERFNGRDPNDGELQFEFNCGGWQTEGWGPIGTTTNIAGSQGYLDFTIPAAGARLRRAGLNADAAKNGGSLVLRYRCDHDATIALQANDRAVGTTALKASADFAEASIPLSQSWQGTITTLELALTGAAGTRLEIDWIRVR